MKHGFVMLHVKIPQPVKKIVVVLVFIRFIFSSFSRLVV